MEESDDDLSFVSASDSEIAADTDQPSTHIKSPLVKTDVPRECSPVPSLISRSSFRRTGPKRPAPQPPTSPPKKPATSTTVQSKTDSDSTESTVSAAVTMSIGAFASHPIVLVSTKEEVTPTMSASISVSSSDTKLPEGRGWSLTNLQLRHIDDVLEPLSRSFHLPSTTSISSPTTSPSPPPLVPSFANLAPSLSSLPSITSTAFYPATGPGSTVLSTGVPNFPPQNLSSAPNPYFLPPVPSQESIIYGSPIYAPVTPLSYLPQYGSHPSALRPTFFNNSYATKADSGGDTRQEPLPNKLVHSASDPGVNQMMRSGYLMPPAAGASLDRLSEADEDDDSYEEVFYRQEDKDSHSLIPVKPQRRRRLERSDSVGVAHIYEDLLVSSRLNLKVTFTNITMVVIAAAFFMPNSAAILYSFFRLVFGTLFPAYYSYKAVRTKNVKEYVKWMMYWIVFAFFTCAETITDVFVSFWFPFYYEIKILVVLWLLSPATKGSSILYRKFVHPWLTRKEEEIDDCIAKAKQQGYSTVVQLGTKGVNYATNVIMQTALKGGGGLVNQLKRSYSASEIGEDTADHNRNVKALPHKEAVQSPTEEDDISISSGSYESEPPRHRAESESLPTRQRGHSTGRSVRSVKTRSADVSEVYFHDSTETIAQRRSPRTHDAGRTADGGTHPNVTRRSRSGDVSYATLPRTTKRTTVKKRQT